MLAGIGSRTTCLNYPFAFVRLAAFILRPTGGATYSLGYIVKFDHGHYEAYSDQARSCKGKQVVNLGQSIILASKFCSFPGKIGKHHCHFSLIHWNRLSENQPRYAAPSFLSDKPRVNVN